MKVRRFETERIVKAGCGFRQSVIFSIINVFFILLMFVVFSSYIVSHDSIKVNLLKTITSDVTHGDIFIITITDEDIFYVDGSIVSSQELKVALKNVKARNEPVLIKSDRRASVGRIVDVWNLCRNLGIERINIATNEPNR